MKGTWRSLLGCLGVLPAAALAVFAPAHAEDADLTGSWLGRAEHNGQKGSMAIELREHPDHGLVAALSLPDLDAWDIGVVPAGIEGDRLRIGPTWELSHERDGTLRGNLPGFLVAVHEIPVVFRRVEAFERTAQKPIEAPIAEPTWTRDLGSAVWAGLTVEGDLLMVGDDSGHLSALEVATGRTRWEIETGGAIRSRPLIDADTLFVHSDDGNLYALDPANGAERWRAHISAVNRIPLGAEGSRYNNYASSAAVVDEVIYVGGFDGDVVALERASGTELWRFATGETVSGTPGVGDGSVFFGSFSGKVFAVEAESGEELWQYDTGAAVVSSPLVYEGLIVIGSRSYDLLALDAATGEMVWKYYYWFSWIESSLSQRDGVGYVGASDGQDLLALDIRSGRVLWRFDTHGSAWSQPAVTDETVFIGSVGIADYWANHHAAFFAVDRGTGRAIWQFPQERPGAARSWGFAASPAVDEAVVFTADLGGRVYAFRQREKGSP